MLKKSIFYDRVNSDKKAFINFMLQEEKLSSFKKYYQDNIKDKYSINQLRVKILYCSKKSISEEHKSVVNDVIYFDYHIVQYFKSLTKVIKKSSKYEFLEFIGIPSTNSLDIFYQKKKVLSKKVIKLYLSILMLNH